LNFVVMFLEFNCHVFRILLSFVQNFVVMFLD
jgi:hypothetical protein